MLEPQRRLSSNLLLHTDENSKFEREQIYVPLALIERRKPDEREGGVNPEAGTRLYEPNYQEKQRFEHEAFLEKILVKREGRTKGKQIALIGEPGAGKTTLLQTIADWVLEQELGLPIWISLADLGQKEIYDYLFSTWLTPAAFPVSTTIAEPDLKQQIAQGKVWLLLDGVDEVATAGIQALQAIANQLKGWVSPSRVILTCRLNVWEGNNNALEEFETYRLLDFDYPQQAHQFIDNWFSNGNFSEKKERLKTELENTEKARLRDLIQNPLRLTLLCASWQSQEGNLPETKAGLYTQFVEQFYKWKYDRFPISYQEKRSLNKALGRLALPNIDTGNTRFRLRESFIREAMGDDALFEKALQLGWLNNVGIAAESPTRERVYAFFHASFEEYFAALAIDNWDYFVPRDHVDKPVEEEATKILLSPHINQKKAINFLNNLLISNKRGVLRELVFDYKSLFTQDNQETLAAAFKYKDIPPEIASLKGKYFLQHRPNTKAKQKTFGKTGTVNNREISVFVELICTAKKSLLIWKALRNLAKILQNTQLENTQMAGFIEDLKDCLFKEIPKNHYSHSFFANVDKNLWFSRFQACHYVLWHCAQTLSYPEFYQAWHNLPITSHPEAAEITSVGFTSTVQTLDLALLPQLLHTNLIADSTLRDKVELICLDSSKFIEPDNPAAEIYDQILDLGYPERQNGELTTLPQLKLYWHSLRRQSDKLLMMVLYHASNPSPEFSPQFLDALSTFQGAICLVSDESLSVSLQTFSPTQPNLVEAILGWIHQTILES